MGGCLLRRGSHNRRDGVGASRAFRSATKGRRVLSSGCAAGGAGIVSGRARPARGAPEANRGREAADARSCSDVDERLFSPLYTPACMLCRRRAGVADQLGIASLKSGLRRRLDECFPWSTSRALGSWPPATRVVDQGALSPCTFNRVACCSRSQPVLWALPPVNRTVRWLHFSPRTLSLLLISAFVPLSTSCAFSPCFWRHQQHLPSRPCCILALPFPPTTALSRRRILLTSRRADSLATAQHASSRRRVTRLASSFARRTIRLNTVRPLARIFARQ